MSINVHVSGNPIRISRGKMVTADFDPSKKEFDRRRLIRLQQVRDQSKKIAENVRNRVRKEKLMQMKQIEEDGKQKLKNSQNRKLLELQTQYKKALKEIGLGHKEAQDIGDKEDLLEEQKFIEQELASKRGHKATCKLQSQKHEADYKKTAITDRKKLVREIENTRAAMLTNYATQKPSRKIRSNKNEDDETSEDLNIVIPDSSLDSQGSHHSLSDINENDEEPSSSCSCDKDDQSSSEIIDDTTRKNGYSDLLNPFLATNNSTRDVHAIPRTRKQQPYLDSSKSAYLNKTSVATPGPGNTQFTTISSDKNQYEYSHRASPSFVPSSSVTAPPPSISQFVSQKEPLTNKQYAPQGSQGLSYADTRISDRIRGREFAPHAQVRSSPRISQVPDIPSGTVVRDFLQDRKCCINCICHCANRNIESRNQVHSIYKDEVFHGRCKESEDDRAKAPPTTEFIPEQLQQQFLPNKTDVDSRKHPDTSKSNINEIPSKPYIKLKTGGVDKQPSVAPKTPKKCAKPKSSVTKVIPSKKFPAKAPSKTLEDFENVGNISTSRLTTEEFNKLVKPGGSKQHLVQMYDHPNRFGYERTIPSASFVEKIPVESLEVIPDPDMEEHWQETQRRRQREAHIRGKQALEKEKLQREYEEMVKVLPLLQKKERINEIYNDKPEYHMSDERLKEREKAKQNSLENAYNKLFPGLKPAIVTLPKKHQTEERGESSLVDSVDSINVANLNAHHEEPQLFSAQETRDILQSFTQQDPHTRRTKLKQLLKQLKMQKEELLRELSVLPHDGSVADLIDDLRSLNNGDEDKKKTQRKRPRKEKQLDVSIDSVDSSGSEATRLESKIATSKSPRKKAKVKTKVIIRQNASTQTTPKSSTHEEIPKAVPSPPVLQAPPSSLNDIPPLPTCTKFHIPCDCDKENKESSDGKCQILVIHVNDKPEIIVNETEKPVKLSSERQKSAASPNYVDVGVQISDPRDRPKKQKSKSFDAKTNSTLEKSKTWRDHLSKNSISTTSTSYLSPPDFQRRKAGDRHVDYFRKPQQNELSAAFSSQELGHPRVFHYAKKLLSMDRGSVENLSVSSSNIETPTQSIIEIESNNPKGLFLESLKTRDENVIDGRAYSPDYSSVPFNASASGVSSQKEPPNSAVFEDVPCKTSEQKILEQYAEVTDTCTKRIEELADRIEQLKKDKRKMLQVPKCSDKCSKDFSTAYMDLPEYKADSKASKSSSSSLDEEELLRKFTEIDYEFLRQMQQLHRPVIHTTDAPRDKEIEVVTIPTKPPTSVSPEGKDSSHQDSLNQELLDRLRRLQNRPDGPRQVIPANEPNQPFSAPILSDIPVLPKFESHGGSSSSQSSHKRPPPSKGFKKLNGNVNLVPHELSTIVEADSQVSTKVPSPESSRESINFPQLIVIPELQEYNSSSSPNARVPDEKISPSSPKQKVVISKSSSDRTSNTTPKDESNKSIGEFMSLLNSSSKSKDMHKSKDSYDDRSSSLDKKASSSSSTDDLELTELMLRSIGMEWAIPTLRKTEEALALTSSSSSLELTRKKRKDVHTTVSGSEISLREFLYKHLKKVSSSTLITDGTLGSFLAESSDLSGILKTASRDRQRTSTPLGTSKFMSSSKSNAEFSDSELSSIRQEPTKKKKDKRDNK
ncbi:uncharacterized protein LOC114331818 [Diabrotica virgifera virgifera]|uniref:Uncharacterized protein LOC114331818 n=1 Tax=Diabrotica virgifera virgifera TaxID=50390 RepID=A0A6P7FM27_DIAVI|nr:uncharacterized protein LOC114331818 [Diabrotica virgifera virgifera]